VHKVLAVCLGCMLLHDQIYYYYAVLARVTFLPRLPRKVFSDLVIGEVPGSYKRMKNINVLGSVVIRCTLRSVFNLCC